MYLRFYYYKANTQFYFHEYRYVNKKNIRNDIVMLKVIYVERVTIGMCSLKIYIYELTNPLKQSFVFTYCTVSKTTANIHTHVNNPRVTHA